MLSIFFLNIGIVFFWGSQVFECRDAERSHGCQVLGAPSTQAPAFPTTGGQSTGESRLSGNGKGNHWEKRRWKILMLHMFGRTTLKPHKISGEIKGTWNVGGWNSFCKLQGVLQHLRPAVAQVQPALQKSRKLHGRRSNGQLPTLLAWVCLRYFFWLST